MNSSIVYSNQTTASLDVVSFYLFVIEGGIVFVLNSYLALVIFLTKSLRNQKEYIIIASNMSFDAALGLVYFLAGSSDLRIYYTEECKKTRVRNGSGTSDPRNPFGVPNIKKLVPKTGLALGHQTGQI
jgi:hypothetical protein